MIQIWLIVKATLKQELHSVPGISVLLQKIRLLLVTGRVGIGKGESMPKGKKKGYSAKQMKIARVAPPRNKITGADFKALRKKKKKK